MKTRYTIAGGIGQAGRSTFNAGRSTTPTASQQLTGFYVAQVMDDHDPMHMGRVWVYIPGISSSRFDEDGFPLYGSTPPDMDNSTGDINYQQKLRNGWFFVSPILPFAGSDSMRSQNRTDGASSTVGNINSYGNWTQPRIGDNVAVMFHDGDASMGFWFGMIPPFGQYNSVPGMAATPKTQTNVQNGEIVASLPDTAIVPTMDQTPDLADTEFPRISSNYARNLALSGLANDPHRGTGYSSARRESPSYVSGMKSPGWSYDSEKDNIDFTTGKPFSNRESELYAVNSAGHQITMDDHPDHQLMRFRTSSGTTILMNDSCTSPYIYIQTATGGTWIEMTDSGELNIYAQGGIHLHAEDDLDIKVDKNLNLDVGGDVDWRIGGKMSMEVNGNMVTRTGSLTMDITESLDLGIGGYFHSAIGESFHLDAGETIFNLGSFVIDTDDGFLVNTEGNAIIDATGDMKLYSADNMEMSADTIGIKASSNISIDTDTVLSLKSGENINLHSGADLSLLGDGNMYLDATNIIGMVGRTTKVDSLTLSGSVEFPELTSTVVKADMPPMNAVSGPPTLSDILNDTFPATIDTPCGVVPQHQPWDGRCGIGTLNGTNGSLGNRPSYGITTSGACVSRSIDPSSETSLFSQFFRTGASSLTSLVPDSLFNVSLVDIGNGVLSAFPIMSQGLGYLTSNQGEAPRYTASRLASPQEMMDVSGMSLSESGFNAIKRQSGIAYFPKPNLSRTGYVIGYNSPVNEGDVINGHTITSDDMASIRSTSNDYEKRFAITKEEAETRLRAEVAEIEAYLRTNGGEMTQAQFDASVSQIHANGLDNFKSDSSNSSFLSNIASGAFGSTVSTYLSNIYSGETALCGAVSRARSNALATGQPVDRDGVVRGNASYSPVNPVNVSGFDISSTVMDALKNAEATLNPGIPEATLFTLVAQESAFNPYAQATSSSAGGLFQFTIATGRKYGLSSERARSTAQAQTAPYSSYEVYDPYANASAGAMLMNDNYQWLISKGFTNIRSTDLYLAHFLGTGSSSKLNGAYGFIYYHRNSPDLTPATMPQFAAAARANRSIFYATDGTPKTFAQIYQYFDKKIEGRRLGFLNQFNPEITSNTSVTHTGSITWVRGLRNPDFTNVDANVIDAAEKAAQAAGLTSLAFNSGYRSPAVNRAVGGATNSQHLHGRALDIHIGNLTLEQKRAFVTALSNDNRITGIGYGINTIHIDTRPASRVTWKYRGGNSEVRDILKNGNFRNA